MAANRVRRLTVMRLKMIGYEVLETHDRPDGAARVDILFTDLIMPAGLSRARGGNQNSTGDAGHKMLLTSGYAEDRVRADELRRERLSVLRKPYRQPELVTALRNVMGEAPFKPALPA